MGNKIDFLWVVPALPLLGALINLVLGRRLSRASVHFVAVAAVSASFFTALYLIIWPLRHSGAPYDLREQLWHWIYVGGFKIDLTLRLDTLSSVMILIVTGCSTLIHVYSTGYMEHEPRYGAYFGYLNLFTGAMLILVLGANLPVMFIGWEGVGLCSFLLIGFWFENEAYATAGRKAFVVNRIGDFAFLLGMFLLWWAMKGHDGGASLDFGAVRSIGEHHSEDFIQIWWGRERLAAAAGILLFIGAAGKSAQIPLYVWLPDAMAGPTPVSALIHAATMVTAGVYMVARMSFLYAHSTTALAVVATVGALTALLAAFFAFSQNDLKKVLAYSTVSQLGFMFVGVGTGNWTAAIFHLGTHAFFKAGLFLGAGSVMHGMNGSGDIRIMGGLKKYMPVTKWCFWFYCMAIAGFPFFSGFFSKDSILAGAWASHHDGWPVWYGKMLWAMLIIAAFGTAFYMWRLYFLVFGGKYRGKDHVEHPHESPWSMTGPLVILAVLALLAGYIGMPHVAGGGNKVLGFLPHWLGHSLAPMFAVEENGHTVASVVPELHKSTEWILMFVAAGVGIVGIVLAGTVYRNGPSDWVAKWTSEGTGKALYDASYNKLWVDELYDLVIVRPFRWVARGLFEIVDRFMIDTVVVNGSAWVVALGSRVSRWIQNGQVQRYLVGVVLGLVAIFVWTSQAEHPSFSYKRLPDGQIEFRAEPGAGLRSGDAAGDKATPNSPRYMWDFSGSGECKPGDEGQVAIKSPGEVGAKVTLCISDPVFGKRKKGGAPDEWIKVTRRVELPPPRPVSPGTPSLLSPPAKGGQP